MSTVTQDDEMKVWQKMGETLHRAYEESYKRPLTDEEKRRLARRRIESAGSIENALNPPHTQGYASGFPAPQPDVQCQSLSLPESNIKIFYHPTQDTPLDYHNRSWNFYIAIADRFVEKWYDPPHSIVVEIPAHIGGMWTDINRYLVAASGMRIRITYLGDDGRKRKHIIEFPLGGDDVDTPISRLENMPYTRKS